MQREQAGQEPLSNGPGARGRAGDRGEPQLEPQGRPQPRTQSEPQARTQPQGQRRRQPDRAPAWRSAPAQADENSATGRGESNSAPAGGTARMRRTGKANARPTAAAAVQRTRAAKTTQAGEHGANATRGKPPPRARAAAAGAGRSTAVARPADAAERARVRAILRELRRTYPEVTCALHHENPFQLLVATILSAQCTDERVNQVTPGLFAKWGTPQDLARVPTPLLEAEIRSTGFFRSKAKSIQGASQRILDEYGGEVPRTMEELLTLPGVARKTANVVLGTAYGVAVGVVVDTHVKRVGARLHLTRHEDPVKVERDLMAVIPEAEWIWFAHALIWHGRRICVARKPRCGECPLAPYCPSAGTV